MTINELTTKIENSKARSAWDRGVKVYALELLEKLQEDIEWGYFDAEDLNSPKLVERAMLNGAKDWYEYSWGGCALIYNEDIAKRLCTPYELEMCGFGEVGYRPGVTRRARRNPNKREEWLDTQGRALWQACMWITCTVKEGK